MDINKEEYLKRFKVYESDTLFDIEYSDLKKALSEFRCPKCGNKIKPSIDGNLFRCFNKKHKKPFLISFEKLNKIKE